MSRKKYTVEEFVKVISKNILEGKADLQSDEMGQIILYTNMFEWNDGSIGDRPDPDRKHGH